jgi:hypothetical protein
MRPLNIFMLALGVMFVRSAAASEIPGGCSPLESDRLQSDHASKRWGQVSADPGTVLLQAVDTLRRAETSAEPKTPAPAPVASKDPAVLHACERIKRTELFRAQGSFGTFQGYAGLAGPEGLSELRRHGRAQVKGAPDTLPQRITWDQVDRVEVRGGSGVRGAVTGGVLFGTFGALVGMAAIAASTSTDASVGEGALTGFFYVAPVGIALGGLTGMAVRRWVPVYKRSTPAPPPVTEPPPVTSPPPVTAPAPAAAPVQTEQQPSVSTWLSTQVLFSKPTGGFQPPNSEQALGWSFTLSLEPSRWPVALRVEYGRSDHGSSVDSVLVDNPNGYWVDDLNNVQTGSRLTWGMIGAQWSPMKSRTRIYVQAMGGIEKLSPMEVLGDGYPVIEGDVPGLPPSESGFAWSAGVGARLRVPGTDHLAILGEFDYRHLGAAHYVTSPGVEGDYPNSRYVVTSRPVETFTARIGFAVERGR